MNGLQIFNNTLMTGITNPTTANNISIYWAYNCNLTGTLDITPITGNILDFSVYSNSLLTAITFQTTGAITNTFRANSCGLDITFPLGTKIFCNEAVNGIRIQNNGMSVANVDATIDNLYTNRAAFNNTVNKLLDISGTNGAVTGTYQAPVDYVQGGTDGTPASQKEKIYVLKNQTTAGVLKYKWINIFYN